MMKKIIPILLVLCFFFQHSGFSQIAESSPRPLLLRSVEVDPSDGSFAFKADTADPGCTDNPAEVLGYFKTGLLLPDEVFWVNLRPFDAGHMLDQRLETDPLARVLLEADVQLKKDLAGLIHPGTATGRQYWQKLYARAEALFGTQGPVVIPTATRPWIVPGEIILGESSGDQRPAGCFICSSLLKVCLEEDRLPENAAVNADPRMQQLNSYSSELVRELVIPELTRQVNVSVRYAGLRQVFHALILAQWVKRRFPRYAFVFAEQEKPGDRTPWSKMDYFRQYSESFAQGEYNQEEQVHNQSGVVIRRYTSGGIRAFFGGSEKCLSVSAVSFQRFLSAARGLVGLPGLRAEVRISARDGGRREEQSTLDVFSAPRQANVFAMEQENGMSVYRNDDYDLVVNAPLLSEYHRAVARIFVFRSIADPADRVVIVNARGSRPLSDEEVIAYAKIGAFQKQHLARPSAANKDAYLSGMSTVLALDDRSAFKDAIVIADGTFRYFKDGRLESKEMEEFPLRSESRLKGLIGWMQEGRFRGGSIQGASGRWYNERQFFTAVKEEALAQTLDTFADAARRDGGTDKPVVQDPGGIDLRGLIAAEGSISAARVPAGVAEEQVELFLAGCPDDAAQQLRECLRLDDRQRGLSCVLELLDKDRARAVHPHPGLLFLLSRMAE